MLSRRPSVEDIKEVIEEAGFDPSTVRVVKVKKGFKLSLPKLNFFKWGTKK